MTDTVDQKMPLLKLGDHYVSDFLNADETSTDRTKYSLDLYLDETIGAVRLEKGKIAPPESMWGRYWYRSSTNATMKKELKGIVAEITDRVKHTDGDVWLDIACNDGTLLSNVPATYHRVGIDPCDDSFAEESRNYGTIVQDYFSKAAYDTVTDKKAKVITCIAMFYDLDDPAPFIKDLYDTLDDDGVLVLQMSYTPLMVQQMAFDNICHEHVYYYSLTSLAYLFAQHNFLAIDANVNDTNGGSMRVYFVKDKCNPKSFATEQVRQVCMYRTDAFLEMERQADIANPDVWAEFGARLDKLKTDVINFVKTAREEGKTVYGYGASTKGNTLLQYFGLTKEDIVAIAERSPYKFGKRTIGTEIPIISEEEMRAARPDYLLVLPWHFIDEFVKRETDFLNTGGALVVPCPEFKIITKDDI
jgi:hypothetical protein